MTLTWDIRGRAVMRSCPFCEAAWPQRVPAADHWPECPALRSTRQPDAVR